MRARAPRRTVKPATIGKSKERFYQMLVRYRFSCRVLSFFWILSILSFRNAPAAALLEERYPGLSMGMLKSAILMPMDANTLLAAGEGIVISEADLMKIIRKEEPRFRLQAEKNQVYLLERAAADRLLLEQAKKAGIPLGDGDRDKAIEAFLDGRIKPPDVSDEEAFAYYLDSKEVIGDIPFEDVAQEVREYLAQEKRQEGIRNYISGLGNEIPLHVNEGWVESNSHPALDNPLDRARRSGKPTLAEFGASNCTACEMMEPILENLRKEYPRSLNIVPVHVLEEHFLASRYNVRSIPVQVFFDAEGKEVFRHVGFLPQSEVLRRLDEMGVQKY